VLGIDNPELTEGLETSGVPVDTWPDLATLHKSLDEGTGVAPDLVVGRVDTVDAGLALLQGWLDDELLADTRIVLVTSCAIDAPRSDADVTTAGVWGLGRSARVENPGRVVLADVDGTSASWAALAGAVASGEPD
jgi:hypothetical protein